MRCKWIAVLMMVLMGVWVAGCKREESRSGAGGEGMTGKAIATPPEAETAPEAEKQAEAEKPPQVAEAPPAKPAPVAEAAWEKTPGLYATLETAQGRIVCQLFPDKTPKTVANFVGLAKGTKEWTDPKTGKRVKKPFYDGLIFHRIIPGFMIQGGDPLGNGRGGPGYKFQDEFVSSLKFTKPGRLAMANSGPNTNGSQFFITTGTPEDLNGKHTIFGQVVQGQDIAEKITLLSRDMEDHPTSESEARLIKVIIKQVGKK